LGEAEGSDCSDDPSRRASEIQEAIMKARMKVDRLKESLAKIQNKGSSG